MNAETRSWLRTLEGLGDQARRRVFVQGEQPTVVARAMADSSVDPRLDVDWVKLCDDLGLKFRQSNSFAAMCELHAFSLSVIEEMVAA